MVRTSLGRNPKLSISFIDSHLLRRDRIEPLICIGGHNAMFYSDTFDCIKNRFSIDWLPNLASGVVVNMLQIGGTPVDHLLHILKTIIYKTCRRMRNYDVLHASIGSCLNRDSGFFQCHMTCGQNSIPFGDERKDLQNLWFKSFVVLLELG